MSDINEPTTGVSQKLDRIDVFLLLIVTLVLILVCTLLGINLYNQNHLYNTLIDYTLTKTDQNIQGYALAFSKSLDFAVAKICSIFIGFLLVLIGALYIIKVFNVSYKLNAEVPEKLKLSLESSSPGLVLSTLGVVVLIFSITTKYELELKDYTNEPSFIIKDTTINLPSIDSAWRKLNPQKPDSMVSKPVISKITQNKTQDKVFIINAQKSTSLFGDIFLPNSSELTQAAKKKLEEFVNKNNLKYPLEISVRKKEYNNNEGNNQLKVNENCAKNIISYLSKFTSTSNFTLQYSGESELSLTKPKVNEYDLVNFSYPK